jgi:hypothetical protein
MFINGSQDKIKGENYRAAIFIFLLTSGIRGYWKPKADSNPYHRPGHTLSQRYKNVISGCYSNIFVLFKPIFLFQGFRTINS